MYCAVGIAQGSDAQGEVDDSTGEAVDFDVIANVVLILEKDKDAVEYIFEEGLRTETDANSDNASGGAQRGKVDIEDGEDMEQDDKADDAICGGAQDGGDGSEFRGALGGRGLTVCQDPHAMDEEIYDLGENKGDDQDDDHAGKIAMDEGEEIAMPLMEHIGKVVEISGEIGVLLRCESQEEHDGTSPKIVWACVSGHGSSISRLMTEKTL